jgi:hypothetical protein
LCGEGGHRERRCPDLSPESDGFWKGQRMADDEEEECRVAKIYLTTQTLIRFRTDKSVLKIALLHNANFSYRNAKHQTYNKLIKTKITKNLRKSYSTM